MEVRLIRCVAVLIVLGVTGAGAEWAYTYQVPVVITFGRTYGHHAPERTTEQAWWGASLTLLIILVGAAALMLLLPQLRRMPRRFRAQFGTPAPRRRRDPSGPVHLRGRSR